MIQIVPTHFTYYTAASVAVGLAVALAVALTMDATASLHFL